MLWALADPDMLTDDYALLAAFDDGIVQAVRSLSFEHPARPLLGPYHLITHGVVGDRPVVHALILAALNAAVVVAMWRYGRRWFGPGVASIAAALYAVAPNRASTRYWFPTGNHLLAILLVLVGVHLLVDRRRIGPAAVALASAVLLFEGVIGLAVGAVTIWAWPAFRQRLKYALLALAPSISAAGWMYWMSPKRRLGTGPDTSGSVSTLGHGLFGSGLWGDALGVVGVALAVAITTVAVAGALPSFRRMVDRTQVARAGAALTAFAAGAFVAAGTSFAVRGIFDRTNAVPLVGVALLLAGSVYLLGQRRQLLAVVAWAPAVAYLFLLNLADLQDYREAAEEGRAIAGRVTDDLPADIGDVIVFPSGQHDTGVAAYIYPSDLDAALDVRGHEHDGAVLIPWSAAQCMELAVEMPQAVGYDWLQRELVDEPLELCQR